MIGWPNVIPFDVNHVNFHFTSNDHWFFRLNIYFTNKLIKPIFLD